MLTFLEQIRNVNRQVPDENGLIVPFILREELNLNDFNDNMKAGSDYFHEKIIFTHEGVSYIRFGQIKAEFIKLMIKPVDVQNGFVIAFKHYLTHGKMYGSPMNYYDAIKEKRGYFPLFHDLCFNFFPDLSDSVESKEDVTNEEMEEKFFLGDIFQFEEAILYHNKGEEEPGKIKPNDETTLDLIGWWSSSNQL
jgi:hypothetical protein